MAHRPVTLADIVAGHVSLEIEGVDRIYLNGWVPALRTSGQVAGWLHWRGFPIASPAALGRNSQAFRAAVRRYAQDHDVPWVTFRMGDRKLDVIRPYLEAAEKAGHSKVVAIGEAREFQWVFDATRKQDADGVETHAQAVNLPVQRAAFALFDDVPDVGWDQRPVERGQRRPAVVDEDQLHLGSANGTLCQCSVVLRKSSEVGARTGTTIDSQGNGTGYGPTWM